MSSRCSICNLAEPIRSELNDLLSAHTLSLSEIVTRFAPKRFGAPQISRSALDRHRRRCLARQELLAELAPRPEIVPALEDNRLLALTASVQSRLETLLQSAVAFLENAETLSDPKAGLSAIRECRKTLELVARLRGELHADAMVAVQINNANDTPFDPSRLSVPEMVELRRLVHKARGQG